MAVTLGLAAASGSMGEGADGMAAMGTAGTCIPAAEVTIADNSRPGIGFRAYANDAAGRAQDCFVAMKRQPHRQTRTFNLGGGTPHGDRGPEGV